MVCYWQIIFWRFRVPNRVEVHKVTKKRNEDNIQLYYMTSSVIGQDEPNLALWLATREGTMELSCPLGILALSRKENLSCFGVLSHIINPVLTKLVRKMAGYWLVLFLRVYSSRPIKNLSNIQPPWPHTWSITHVSFHYSNERSALRFLDLSVTIKSWVAWTFWNWREGLQTYFDAVCIE